MSASPTDLRAQTATLRRRVWTLVLALVVGMLAGVGYVMVEPTPMTSTALVLLPTAAGSDSSSSDVATQVRIATSVDILARAAQIVDPSLSARRVEDMLEVSAPTNQLLDITVTSADGQQAQKLAQAVADSFVDYVRYTAREVTQAVLIDLNRRRDDLSAQIRQLQDEIAASKARLKREDPNSAEGRAEARITAELRAQVANLSGQLETVEDKIATGTPVGSSASGTSVIQKATVAVGPPLVLRLVIWAPAAGVGALLLTGAVILIATRRDNKVRARDDIADAVSSPVLASLRSRPQRSAAAWLTLLEAYRAAPVEAWSLRQVLRSLTPVRGQHRVPGKIDHPGSITMVSLAGDSGGSAIGPQLAAFAASLGVPTLVVPTQGDDYAPALWACAVDEPALKRPNLFLGGLRDGEQAELVVYLVVVDRTRPHLQQTPPSEALILSVTSGAASEADLARVAVAVDDHGRRIDGIVVADPDPADRTTGRHTISDRSQWPALPTRLTGGSSSAGPDSKRITP